jgi:outer membrane protein assembly factor BamA
MKLPNRIYIIIFLTLLFCSSETIYGQDINILIKPKDSTSLQLTKESNIKQRYANLSEAKNAVNLLKKKLNESGFLNSELVLKKNNDSTYTLESSLNTKIDSITIKLPKHFLSREHNTEVTISFSKLRSFIKKLKNDLEDSGDTFSELSFTDIETIENRVFTTLQISTNKTRKIDKVIFKGYRNFPYNYKKQYLRLKKEITFNKKNISAISNKIKNLDFITQFKEPEFLFTSDSTFLYLYTKKKRINQFDGLIGFNSNENGKLIFNGHLDITLKNNFNKGEVLSFFWSNNGKEQQDLKLLFSTPYIYGSIFSPEINLKIHKQDSTFINTTLKGTININLSSNHSLGATLKKESSENSLTISNNTIQNFNKTLYGLTYSYKLFTKQTIPKIKTQIHSSIEIGTRDAATKNTKQTVFHLKLEQSVNLFSKSSLYMQNTSKVINSNNILFNELYQIGGATTIRGFNEKSIFASSFNYSNIEYRLLTGQESYMYTFSDIGFIHNKIDEEKNTLTSFGVGYSYRTKNGHMNINYSIGKTNKSKLDLDKGLFHIKFVNYF